jgi:thioesterase domain-containing protein/NRPS condensation-like uncharacterized protein
MLSTFVGSSLKRQVFVTESKSFTMRDAVVEQKCFPVSLSQQRLWILNQLEPGIAAYQITACLRLTGPLALGALERSLDAIVDRHEALRTTFDVCRGAPVQVIKSSCAIRLQTVDMSTNSGPALEAQAYSFAREESQKPFDLKNGPLLRAALLRLGAEQHILICTMHHIVSDGWSAELLIRELTEHYAAFVAGRAPSLKPLAMQYSDFAVLQRHLIRSEGVEQQLSFWRRTLAGAPVLHDFPCDRARPERPTYAGANQTLQLDNELVADLRQFARHQGTTFFTLLVATFLVLLFKYGKRKDILVGIPVSGRSPVETEALIGFFVNTLVLRTSISENQTFDDVLFHVRESLLDAMSHQDVPFEWIVDAVQAPRGLGYNPLFQIMFATFRAAVQSRQFGELTAMPYFVESSTSRFDLSVNIIEGLDMTWCVQAEYSTELFDGTRIASMLEAYRTLLRSILTSSRRRLSDLQISHSAGGLQSITSDTAPRPSADSPTNPVTPSGLDLARRNIALKITQRANTPIDDVEGKLIDIWQRFLKASPIGVKDDFFALGGNSLLAIALVSEVNRTFGKILPVSSLFRDATIRSMAKRLRGQPASRSSFVPLNGTGTKPPLFAVGWCHEYRDLSRALGKDQPFYQMDVYALQEERVIVEAPLFTTVQAIANCFVREILSLQSFGPYFLAGRCEGSIVALEIARQLQGQGHQIGALMQFDTPATGYFTIKLPWYRRVSWALARVARGEQQYVLTLVRNKIRRSLAPTTEDYIWKIIWDAVRAYETDKRFKGEIVLFRAEQQPPMPIDNVAVGWDRLGAVRIYDVPGDHVRLFINPTAQSIIQEVLEDAQRRVAAAPSSKFQEIARGDVDPR